MSERAYQPVHTEDCSRTASRQANRIWVVLAVLLMVLVFICAEAFQYRDNTLLNNPRELPAQLLCMAATVVIGSVMIFLSSLKLAPRLRYLRFLKEIHSGLSRNVVGQVTEMDLEPTFRDGLSFTGILINVGDLQDPEDDRQLYWDQRLGDAPFQVGQGVALTAHGNDIIGTVAGF